ncbi:MAG: thiopurine S-methyltransferase [Hyphomicrobiaceae bacterium]
MERNFWLERWEKGETGWHRDDVHPELIEHWSTLDLPQRSRVLVPLCGASLDMAWLASQGHEVIGVELSQSALEQFLARHRVRHIVMDENGFRTYLGGRYQLWCGDFFALPAEVFASADAVYDRASLIALPPDMRKRYAATLGDRLTPGSRILLIALDYDANEMNGPPFPVPDDEIRALFDDRFDIIEIKAVDVLKGNAGLRQRGLTELTETTYVLTRKL